MKSFLLFCGGGFSYPNMFSGPKRGTRMVWCDYLPFSNRRFPQKEGIAPQTGCVSIFRGFTCVCVSVCVRAFLEGTFFRVVCEKPAGKPPCWGLPDSDTCSFQAVYVWELRGFVGQARTCRSTGQWWVVHLGSRGLGVSSRRANAPILSPGIRLSGKPAKTPGEVPIGV